MTAFLVGRSRYRLALVRTITPQLVTAGQPAQVQLELTNEGRTPTGVLLLEDHVPYVLGTRPRFVLEGIGHGWHRSVTYQVRSDVRGRFDDRTDDGPGHRPLRAGRARRAFQHHRPADRHPRAPSRCRRSRSPAHGPAPATTGRARSRPAARRT